jgi:hypothetical protein
MSRFVVLLHETPAGYPRGTHFDLMLEDGGRLRTWAVERLPTVGHPVAAEQLADHRLEYLAFAGELTGGRGSVRRVEAGTYDVVADGPCLLVVRLAGERMCGVLTLAREAEADQRWVVSLSEL